MSPFSGSVTLAASGLPSGVTAAFTVNPATTTSVVTFSVSGTAPAGTTTVIITGTSGGLTASTPIALTVTAATTTGTMACTIGYTTTPQSSVAFGAAFAIDNTGTANWGSWSLTWTWANGQSSTDVWNAIYTQSGANATLTNESYNGTIAAGSSYSGVGFDGTWNGVTNSAPTNFAVNGTTCVNGGSGFTLLASTPNLALGAGSSATDTVTVKDFGGFTGSVTLSASNLPSGITAAFGTNPTTGSSVVTFTATAAVLSGTDTVTITGTSGTTTATTTIALTVNGTTDVTVNPASKGLAVTNQLLGMNMASWYDIVVNQAAIVPAFETAGIKAVRWPGGGWSDVYHWATNTNCLVAPYGTDAGEPQANDTFANFVNDLVIPAGLDVALTADYGTDAACTGPGQPSEAAAWAANALSLGITVSHMTVGNEVYGATWEEDLHSPANNPAEYASTMIGSSGWYDTIKAASPKTLVGVVVEADNTAGGWDNTVMANAKGSYDFVEYHYYPQAPGAESDTTLIDQDAQLLTTNIDILKSELAEWGTAGTPIYVGEMGSVYTDPGRQSWSITQGLFTGQVLGEMMNDGIVRATWWIGFGNCFATAGNFGATLYGWQDFGAYNVFSDGPNDPTGVCPGEGPIGTLSPTADAFQLFSNVAVTGENVLTPTVNGDTTDVVAYAATHSGGTALFLVNRNETTSQTVSIAVTGQTSAASATVITYDRAIYDLSGSPTGTFPDPLGTSTWAPPTTTTISSPTLPLTLTLAPWSMNVVIIP
ncbi:MAG: cellulose binding domain-containing protein [Terracidiphilus sp.]